MKVECPRLLPAAVICDDAYLAARLSCAVSKRGYYLPVMDGPRMSRDDREAEAARRNNAIARSQVVNVLLGGLPDDAGAAMRALLPQKLLRDVKDDDVSELILDDLMFSAEPLTWGKERIGEGLLTALYQRRMIVFEDGSSPINSVEGPSGHLVVCEMGEPLSEVIAANYAFALGAGLHLIDPVDETEAHALLEDFYSIDAPGANPAAIRERLGAKFRELCGDIKLPKEGSLTFVSKHLPFGIGFPELPSTHLFQYPDLGIAVLNGFAAEQKGRRGTNVAVVVDPEKVRAPEIEAAKTLLPKRSIFLRGYSGMAATVRNVSEMLDLFPYDLLIFATHCGDADGYRETYKFKDSEGINRTLVVDLAIGVADTDDPEMLRVSQFMRFHSLDGVDWTDPVEKAKLHVGTAIVDFMKLLKDGDDERVDQETIPRVLGSAAMAMADSNLLIFSRSLAMDGSPVIINNACVSWHELASRFTFGNARAYIGTLYSVSDMEAEAVVVRLLDKEFGKWLPHALWNAQRVVYGKDDGRRPYVATGVYTQKLRATQEAVPLRLLKLLTSARTQWEARRKKQKKLAEGSKRLDAICAFYEQEIEGLHERWFQRPKRTHAEGLRGLKIKRPPKAR